MATISNYSKNSLRNSKVLNENIEGSFIKFAQYVYGQESLHQSYDDVTLKTKWPSYHMLHRPSKCENNLCKITACKSLASVKFNFCPLLQGQVKFKEIMLCESFASVGFDL